MPPHDFKEFPELTNSQMEFYYWDSPHKQITDDFTAKVIKVTDGDTIRVKWEERDFDFPIRLSFIDAPELGKEGGIKSRGFLEQILREEVLIKIDPNNRLGKFGRILGEIIFLGMSMNNLSLDFGYSVPFGSENALEFR